MIKPQEFLKAELDEPGLSLKVKSRAESGISIEVAIPIAAPYSETAEAFREDGKIWILIERCELFADIVTRGIESYRAGRTQRPSPWRPTSEPPVDGRAVLARQSPGGTVFHAYCPTYTVPDIDRRLRWDVRMMDEDGVTGTCGIQAFDPTGFEWCYIPGDEP